MKIGILIAGHPPEELSEAGSYATYFERLLGDAHFTYIPWAVVDGAFPEGIHDADGWVITGSKHGAYEPHDWIPPLEQFVRDCYAAAVPMIGVCFGHQVIAQAMGGKVEKFEGGWSVGKHSYRIGDDTFDLNAWHQDQVVVKPQAAEVIGATDFCANAALVYGDRMWSIQPHPEYGHDFIAGLIKERGEGVVPAPLLEAARTTIGTPLDSAKIAQQMTDFFQKERA